MTKKLFLALIFLATTQAEAMFSRVAIAARRAVPAASMVRPAAVAVRTFKDRNSNRPLDVERAIFLEKCLYGSPEFIELKNTHHEMVKEAYRKSMNSKEYTTALHPLNRKYLEELEKLYQQKLYQPRKSPVETHKPLAPHEREAVAVMITGALGALTTPLIVFLAWYL